MLDLNLIGPNHSKSDWESQLSNIGSLLSYTAKSGMHAAAWEIGNENQGELTTSEAAQRVSAALSGVFCFASKQALLYG